MTTACGSRSRGDALRRSPEVVSVISKAGRPEDGTDPKPINMAEVFVDVKPPGQWTRHISREQLIQEMQAALETIPGVHPSFSQPIRDNVLESISQIDGQIVIKVFSTDPEVLRNKTREVLRTILLPQAVGPAKRRHPRLRAHSGPLLVAAV